VLALSDAALARLCIAAGRVPRARRRRWLATVARQLEQGEPVKPIPLAPSTLRTRVWRERRERGEITLRIRANEAELVAMLVGCDVVNVNRADDPRALAKGVERLLAKLGDTSRRDDSIADTIRAQLLLSSKRT
jgi:hypothetical protein